MANGFKSIYYSNLILGLAYGRTAWTPPATWYLALFTVLPNNSGAGGTEFTGVSRLAISNNTTSFNLPASGQLTNAITLTVGTPSAGGIIVGAGFFDASSSGNLYDVFTMLAPLTAVIGVPIVISPGQMILTEG